MNCKTKIPRNVSGKKNKNLIYPYIQSKIPEKQPKKISKTKRKIGKLQKNLQIEE